MSYRGYSGSCMLMRMYPVEIIGHSNWDFSLQIVAQIFKWFHSSLQIPCWLAHSTTIFFCFLFLFFSPWIQTCCNEWNFLCTEYHWWHVQGSKQQTQCLRHSLGASARHGDNLFSACECACLSSVFPFGDFVGGYSLMAYDLPWMAAQP